MKDLKLNIRNLIEEKSLLTPTLKNYAARRDWWYRNYPEYAEFIFPKFDECNSIYPIKLSPFLKWLIYDEDHPVCEKPEDVFIKHRPEPLNVAMFNKGVRVGETKRICARKALDSVSQRFGFEIKNAQEARFCILNDVKERPRCLWCSGDVEFVGASKGFRSFCSARCQNSHHNRQKEVMKTGMSDEEIRKFISLIPVDRRNLNTEEIASVFANVSEYALKVRPDAIPSEALHIFMNKLSRDDITCPICQVNFKKFRSQTKGYRKTCGCKSCVLGTRGTGKFYPGVFSFTAGPYSVRGDVKYRESGFLYILKSENMGVFKIGITQDVAKRIKTIARTVNDIEIYDCFYLKNNLIKTERKIHKMFNEKRAEVDGRISGSTEFFVLDGEDLRKIEEMINEIRTKR